VEGRKIACLECLEHYICEILCPQLLYGTFGAILTCPKSTEKILNFSRREMV